MRNQILMEVPLKKQPVFVDVSLSLHEISELRRAVDLALQHWPSRFHGSDDPRSPQALASRKVFSRIRQVLSLGMKEARVLNQVARDV